MNFKIVSLAQQQSTVEASAFDSKIKKTADGTYCMAVIATGQGPYGIAAVAAQAFVKQATALCEDPSLFENNAATWKFRIAAKMNEFHSWLKNAASELNVSALASATAALIRPDNGLNILSIGNTISLIKRSNTGEIAIGNKLDVASYLASNTEEPQEYPADITLFGAMGVNQSIKPHASKTTLSNHDTIFLLSAGFARNLSQYSKNLKNADDINLQTSSLIEAIKTKRGLACGDVVAGIHLEEGEDSENGTADQAGVPAETTEAR